jgi:hypothetical protein
MDPNSTTAVARLHAVQNHLSIQPCFQRHAIHNDKPTGPADLARERANASFKVEDMTEVILRGKENVEALVSIRLYFTLKDIYFGPPSLSGTKTNTDRYASFHWI